MASAGRVVGRYEIIREAGRGGMAVVYLARQAVLERDVALKELSAIHVGDRAFGERFLREARVSSALTHPNIVTVHEYFEYEGVPYIAMEYLSRGSLRPLVHELSTAQVAGVLEGVLAGLSHAARDGVVHRDLKPENLMVTAQGTVKITDFGIAKAYSSATTGRYLTAVGTTVGTPAYMAPEQAMAQELGPWTDLYSTGIVAYEMLVGRLPFEAGSDALAILMKHVHEPLPPPRLLNADLDPRLEAWLQRMLQKEPAARFASAGEAWEALEDAVISILGPRWRREGRLATPTIHSGMTKPLTPAPFYEETRTAPTAATGYVTFGQGEPPPPPPPPPSPPAQEPQRVPPPVVPPDEPKVPVQPAVPVAPPATVAPAPVAASAPAETFVWPARPQRRSPPRALVLGSLAVLVAIGAGVAWFATRGGSSAAPSSSLSAKGGPTGVVVLNPVASASITATATTTLPPANGFTYEPSNTLDGNLCTAWNDDSAGNGVGQSLTYTFQSPERVVRVAFVGAYVQSPTALGENERLQSVQVIPDSRAPVSVSPIPDAPKWTTISYDFGPTRSLTLRVTGVYPGGTYQDLAVTEVRFWRAAAAAKLPAAYHTVRFRQTGALLTPTCP